MRGEDKRVDLANLFQGTTFPLSEADLSCGQAAVSVQLLICARLGRREIRVQRLGWNTFFA